MKKRRNLMKVDAAKGSEETNQLHPLIGEIKKLGDPIAFLEVCNRKFKVCCPDCGHYPGERGQKTTSDFNPPDFYLQNLTRFEGKIAFDAPSKDNESRIVVYTSTHNYRIVFRPPVGENEPNGYMGCVASDNSPREGEDWTRGNDLADGSYSDATWRRILADIVAYEIAHESAPQQPASEICTPIGVKYRFTGDFERGTPNVCTLYRQVSMGLSQSSQKIATFSRLQDVEWITRLLNGGVNQETPGSTITAISNTHVEMLVATSPFKVHESFVREIKQLAGKVLTIVDASINGVQNNAIKTLIRKEFRGQIEQNFQSVYMNTEGGTGCEAQKGELEL